MFSSLRYENGFIMNSNKKISKISKEIINPSLDLSIDYTEIGIDELLNNNILKEIPIVKTLVAIAKTGIAIRERFFIKKFLVFLSEFKTNKIDEISLKKFREKFKKNEKFRNKTTEQILIIIEELDSIKKSKILAHLFNAYLKKYINWQRFISLSNCLKNLQEITFDYLRILSKKEFNFTINTGRKTSEIDKIIKKHKKGINQFSTYELEALLIASGVGLRSGTLFRITELGQDLYKYGIAVLKNS